MNLWLVLLGVVIVVVGVSVLAYLGVKAMSRREPYGAFLKLSTRNKVAFFRRLLKSKEVPWFVKAAPFVMAAYLLMPFDLIPDFIPVLGYMDDVGMVLLTLAFVMRFTPRSVVESAGFRQCRTATLRRREHR